MTYEGCFLRRLWFHRSRSAEPKKDCFRPLITERRDEEGEGGFEGCRALKSEPGDKSGLQGVAHGEGGYSAGGARGRRGAGRLLPRPMSPKLGCRQPTEPAQCRLRKQFLLTELVGVSGCDVSF